MKKQALVVQFSWTFRPAEILCATVRGISPHYDGFVGLNAQGSS
jgi:hypothetical protein